MSYSAQPVGFLGETTYRTAPDGSLVPETRSWWEKNRQNVYIGGAVIGGLALIGLIGYAKYKRNMALQERYGVVGGAGAAVGLDVAEAALLGASA